MDRPLSLRISAGWNATAKDVITALFDVLGTDSVSCVQPFGRGRYEITLKQREHIERLLDEGLIVNENKVDCLPCHTDLKWVTIRGMPFEGSNDALSEALRPYGEVLKIDLVASRDFPTVSTGVRKVSMIMSEPIPDEILILEARCRVSYQGVVRRCYSCKETGHISRNCPTPKACHRCGSMKHLRRQCDRSMVRPQGPEMDDSNESQQPEVAANSADEEAGKLRPLDTRDESEGRTSQATTGQPTNKKIAVLSPTANEITRNLEEETEAAVNSILYEKDSESSEEESEDEGKKFMNELVKAVMDLERDVEFKNLNDDDIRALHDRCNEIRLALAEDKRTKGPAIIQDLCARVLALYKKLQNRLPELKPGNRSTRNKRNKPTTKIM